MFRERFMRRRGDAEKAYNCRLRVREMRLMRALPLAVVSLLFSAAAPSDVAFVPWKIHGASEELPVSPLVLYWVPASADDFRHSDLLTSRVLASYAAQCVALEVVRSDDAAMLTK